LEEGLPRLGPPLQDVLKAANGDTQGARRLNSWHLTDHVEGGQREPRILGTVHERRIVAERGAVVLIEPIDFFADAVRGRREEKRAIVAVARKLAVLLHRLWVTGEAYEPLRNSKHLASMKAA
jgi:hypothetical protein